MKTACIIVAAGRGTRASTGAGSQPKQYQRIGGLPVLTRTIAGLIAHPGVGPILVVIHADDRAAYDAATAHFGDRLLPPVIGGATRQDSVRQGLEALAAFDPQRVLIHDAARPFVTRDTIDRVIAALNEGAGAIPALAVADTLKRGAAGLTISETVARNGLYRAQTPQGFRFADILAAHRAAAMDGRTDFTDDAAVAEWRGLRVTLVEGDENNRKLTTVQDIREADRDFRDGAQEGQERRNGLCRLSHPLAAGAALQLFGVDVPHRLGLAGAPASDLGFRTVAGALLDVVGGEDDESVDLSEAVRRAEESGGGIASVDVTIVSDGLTIDAQADAMRAALAEKLGLQKARVGVRTGRAQQLGLLHRADEISVLASATVNVPVIAATAMPRAAKRAAPVVAPPPAAVTQPPLGEGTPLLDTVRIPADLRRLDDSQLPQLADELRRETIAAVSETGGHLGAGLGVIELTIAIHKVFDTPKDRLIWDVGHQAYPHKILTGRRDRIRTLRQGGGLSGFTKRAESEYDPFGTAHSSTSISAGLGMAVARDLRGDDNNVIAVIGDGSMSAGMAYEAMNNAGALGERLIVILNDNDMSIAQPVGSLSAYLARLSSSSAYFRLRDAVKHLASKLPERWERRAARAEELTRTYWTGGTFFEELGFHYVGPLDGHDFNHLLPVLRNARDATKGPILIHVVTQKGKGYAPAEAADDKYHGVSRFNVITGKQVKPPANAPSYTRVFADTLIQEARRDPEIVAVTAAMPTGTGLDLFGQEFPARMFDVGIAEQHAVTFAAGLATEGFKPFVAIYSTFMQRAYDQIVHDVALQNLPVRFALDRAGLVGADGPTHAGAFDTAYLGCIPNMVLMAAADEAELRHMVATQVALDDAPSALRFPRGEGVGVDMPERGAALEIGRGRVLREGERVALLSYGTRLAECLKAAEILAAQGVSCTVADARFAKPLDHDLVDRLARGHEALVTIEEGSIGGFGSAVLHRLVESGVDLAGLKVRTMVLPDTFIDHDKPEAMYAQAGLDAAGIVATARGALGAEAPRARRSF